MIDLYKTNISCDLSKNKIHFEEKINNWIKNIYQIILIDLKYGNINPILFDIFDEQEFQKCFGFSKKTAQIKYPISHIRQHRE